MAPQSHGSRIRRLGLFALSVALMAVAVVHADTPRRSLVNCDIQNGACTRVVNGRQMTMDISPKPVRAMTELTFTVSVDGGGKAHGRIELNMLAMDMGENHVPLKWKARGVYEGTGVIVRCRSGIRTWIAKVVIPGVGATEYIFDVVY